MSLSSGPSQSSAFPPPKRPKRRDRRPRFSTLLGRTPGLVKGLAYEGLWPEDLVVDALISYEQGGFIIIGNEV